MAWMRLTGQLAGLDAQDAVDNFVGDGSWIFPVPRETMSAHLQAVWNYLPPVYSGRVILFRVQALPLTYPCDPEMGWGTLAAGGVEIKTIAGAHHNCLREPHVAALAAALNSSLVRAEATGNDLLSA